MHKVEFKGIEIAYTEQGKGPAVVFLHGFLENSLMWESVAPHFSKSHRVIRIDLPGHGQSDNIGYVHTMDEMAEAVMSVLKHLRIRRSVFVGHSMGGYVSLALAEAYPDNVKALVLFQSTARADSAVKKRDRLRAIELVKKNPSSFVRKAIPMLFRPVNRKRFRNEVAQVKLQALTTSVQGITAALEGMRQRPNREVLLKFPPYPVRFIVSDKDPVIPLDSIREQATLSDAVDIHVIKGSGHMSHIEDEKTTIALLKKAIP